MNMLNANRDTLTQITDSDRKEAIHFTTLSLCIVNKFILADQHAKAAALLKKLDRIISLIPETDRIIDIINLRLMADVLRALLHWNEPEEMIKILQTNINEYRLAKASFYSMTIAYFLIALCCLRIDNRVAFYNSSQQLNTYIQVYNKYKYVYKYSIVSISYTILYKYIGTIHTNILLYKSILVCNILYDILCYTIDNTTVPIHYISTCLRLVDDIQDNTLHTVIHSIVNSIHHILNTNSNVYTIHVNDTSNNVYTNHIHVLNSKKLDNVFVSKLDKRPLHQDIMQENSVKKDTAEVVAEGSTKFSLTDRVVERPVTPPKVNPEVLQKKSKILLTRLNNLLNEGSLKAQVEKEKKDKELVMTTRKRNSYLNSALTSRQSRSIKRNASYVGIAYVYGQKRREVFDENVHFEHRRSKSTNLFVVKSKIDDSKIMDKSLSRSRKESTSNIEEMRRKSISTNLQPPAILIDLATESNTKNLEEIKYVKKTHQVRETKKKDKESNGLHSNLKKEVFKSFGVKSPEMLLLKRPGVSSISKGFSQVKVTPPPPELKEETGLELTVLPEEPQNKQSLSPKRAGSAVHKKYSFNQTDPYTAYIKKKNKRNSSSSSLAQQPTPVVQGGTTFKTLNFTQVAESKILSHKMLHSQRPKKTNVSLVEVREVIPEESKVIKDVSLHKLKAPNRSGSYTRRATTKHEFVHKRSPSIREVGNLSRRKTFVASEANLEVRAAQNMMIENQDNSQFSRIQNEELSRTEHEINISIFRSPTQNQDKKRAGADMDASPSRRGTTEGGRNLLNPQTFDVLHEGEINESEDSSQNYLGKDVLQPPKELFNTPYTIQENNKRSVERKQSKLWTQQMDAPKNSKKNGLNRLNLRKSTFEEVADQKHEEFISPEMTEIRQWLEKTKNRSSFMLPRMDLIVYVKAFEMVYGTLRSNFNKALQKAFILIKFSQNYNGHQDISLKKNKGEVLSLPGDLELYELEILAKREIKEFKRTDWFKPFKRRLSERTQHTSKRDKMYLSMNFRNTYITFLREENGMHLNNCKKTYIKLIHRRLSDSKPMMLTYIQKPKYSTIIIYLDSRIKNSNFSQKGMGMWLNLTSYLKQFIENIDLEILNSIILKPVTNYAVSLLSEEKAKLMSTIFILVLSEKSIVVKNSLGGYEVMLFNPEIKRVSESVKLLNAHAKQMKIRRTKLAKELTRDKAQEIYMTKEGVLQEHYDELLENDIYWNERDQIVYDEPSLHSEKPALDLKVPMIDIDSASLSQQVDISVDSPAIKSPAHKLKSKNSIIVYDELINIMEDNRTNIEDLILSRKVSDVSTSVGYNLLRKQGLVGSERSTIGFSV